MFNFDRFELIVITCIILITLITCCIFGLVTMLSAWLITLIFNITITSFKLFFIIGFLIGLSIFIKLTFF